MYKGPQEFAQSLQPHTVNNGNPSGAYNMESNNMDNSYLDNSIMSRIQRRPRGATSAPTKMSYPAMAPQEGVGFDQATMDSLNSGVQQELAPVASAGRDYFNDIMSRRPQIPNSNRRQDDVTRYVGPQIGPDGSVVNNYNRFYTPEIEGYGPNRFLNPGFNPAEYLRSLFGGGGMTPQGNPPQNTMQPMPIAQPKPVLSGMPDKPGMTGQPIGGGLPVSGGPAPSNLEALRAAIRNIQFGPGGG